MKLYIYDHCPYCVKARMIFGFKNQDLELKTLLNDDEKTPISMIGAKMLPILEYQTNQFMPESMDIVAYLDKLNLPKQVQNSQNNQLMDFLNKNGSSCYRLAMPRWVKAPLEEFKTQEAKDYFQTKKESYIGAFNDNLNESKNLILEIEEELNFLESLFTNKQKCFENKLSFNDFHLFPFLRSLSIVKDLSFPPKIRFYMEEISKSSKVPLHFDIAL